MAQFCASCGDPLAAMVPGAAFGQMRAPVGAPGTAPAPGYAASAGGLSPHVLLRCPHCGVPAAPVPYFSRGANVAKAFLLMIPMSFLGPFVFFLMRKDRMICAACRQILSSEAAFALGQGAHTGMALAAYGAGGAAALYEGDTELALVEHKAQKLKRQAWTWGSVAAGLVGLGVLAVFRRHGHAHDIDGFLMAASPPGLIAAVAAFRSRGLGLLARTKRGRQQRLRVLELARQRGGRLNVSYVAASLQIELNDAEALLGSMVDGHRVEMEVDDNGRISYVFTELHLT